MFTIDLYTSYTALLTVFTTIQRIFAQKYISERLFMNISAKISKNSNTAPSLDHFQIRLSLGWNCFRYSVTPIGILFMKIIQLGSIDKRWTTADDISETGKVHRESQTKIQLLFMVLTKSKPKFLPRKSP